MFPHARFLWPPRSSQAHWVVEGARTRCMVLTEGDPPPAVSTGGGRISFGGFNAEAEQRRQADEAAQALAAAEANPEGVVITDEGMAAALRKKRGAEQGKSLGSGAGRYFDAGGGANYVGKQQGGGKQRDSGGGKQHSGGKQHGGSGKQHKGGKQHGGGGDRGGGRKQGRRGQDEDERGPAPKKKKFQRYF